MILNCNTGNVYLNYKNESHLRLIIQVSGTEGVCKHEVSTIFFVIVFSQKVSEYDQEIPQSHTADQPTAS